MNLLNPKSELTVKRLFWLVLSIIAALEGLVMLGLHFCPTPLWSDIVVDPILLSFGITPVLFFMIVRPAQKLLRTLQQEISERKHVENDLKDRLKELNCLYDVGDLIEKADRLEQVFQGVVDLIPPALQYPDRACARIVFYEQDFKTEHFCQTPWKSSAEIMVHSRPVGQIEAYYVDEGPTGQECGFLWEEKQLLFAIGDRLGKVIERKQAQEALDESQIRLNKVVSAAQDAIIILDQSGNISMWNESAERIFGYSAQEALGRNLHALLTPVRFHQASSHGLKEFHENGSGNVIGKIVELVAVRKNGEEFPVELSLSSVQIKGAWHAVGILRDITKRKQIEAELQETNRDLEIATAIANDLATQAEIASIAKSEFLANMSHEIRTPMNGVIGMTGLLMDTELDDGQRDYVNAIQSCGESLMVVINDILDFSKIEAGKLQLEELDFDMRDLLEDFAPMMAIRAQEKKLEFLCAANPDVPSYLRGDPGRIRQILTNLSGNAIKFTETGEVAVRVELDTRMENEVLLRFSVRDTGIGIPADKIDELFNKFTQVDASTTRKYGGTGLGLAISKQLAEMMGGQIGVHSEPGKGSEFWCTLRLALQPNQEQSRRKPEQIHGRRILIVDDNATNREILSTRLTSWGVRVTESPDGPSALKTLTGAVEAHTPFDMVITDMQMPQMDGLMLGQAIQKDARLRETCLLMMTSLEQQAGSDELTAAGFRACLTKPIRNSELFTLLISILDKDAAVTSVKSQTQKDLENVFCHYKVRILLAEDNITNQRVTLGILKKFGLHADVAANGIEVLQSLQERDYDLVLMDIQMPQMDGLEAARCIRSAQSSVRNPDIVILAMTACAMQSDQERCIEAGMNDYISKPVAPKSLADKLAQWLPRENPCQTSECAADASQPELPDEIETLIYNRDDFLERLMGDVQAAQAIVDVFLEDIPRQIESLKQAMQICDIETTERIAHTIKGAAANVGGETLCKLAGDIEMACKDKNAVLAGDRLPKLQSQFDLLRNAMQQNRTS